MWDERYNTEIYAYGKTPNKFLAEHYQTIPQGKVLCIAEGEGRNAVFLAKQGYMVTAVDSSKVGLEKAQKLADENGVRLELTHADLADYDFGEQVWDGIVSIFCPLPMVLRRKVHQQVVAALKPEGVFLLEAYTPKQLELGTGGGKSAEVMLTKALITEEVLGLNYLHLVELEREVIEGVYHTGLGSVVQCIGIK